MRISDWSSDVCSSDLALILLPQYLQRADDTPTPTRRQAKEIWATNRAGVRAEGQRLHDMRATADAAVADDLQVAAHGISDRRDLVDRRYCRFELPTAMIGNHHRNGTRFTCLQRIVRTQDALDRQWPAPAGGEPLHVLPRQSSVDLAVHLILQPCRSVGHPGRAMGQVTRNGLPPQQDRKA